ncbi:MAG: glycosyltransferase [Selenomonadaceae bacterium]|nr:glycosyltransferase [Selenomonadaceae bacterium]
MFNVEKYIETCIDSILVQTLTDFEVIVIDDRSEDQSYEIVREKFCDISSSKFDSRIRLFQNIKHAERSFSRNFGIQVARGEFIYFIDSDDAILPNTLETLVNAAEESGAGVVYMNSWFATDDENSISKLPTGESIVSKKNLTKQQCRNTNPRFLTNDIKERINQALRGDLPVFSWIKIQRRESLMKHSICFPLNVDWLEDKYFNLEELCFIEKIQVIDACNYIWRRRSSKTLREYDYRKRVVRKKILAIPHAIKFADEMIQSTNLPEDVKYSLKDEIERQTIRSYFKAAAGSGYHGQEKLGDWDNHINELFKESQMLDSDLIRSLFNIIAKELVK